jgi:hypothetical protein
MATLPTIAFILPGDRKGRRRMCHLTARLHKARITPTDNGKFAVQVFLGGLDNEMQLVGETRLAVARALDKVFRLLADPKTAIQIHAYFRHLCQRACTGGFQSAGDLFRPDGTITNLDVAGTA